MSPTHEWRYWLWENDPSWNLYPHEMFLTLEEARHAAVALGRPLDILRTRFPQRGMGEFVETVSPAIVTSPKGADPQ